VDLGEGAFRKKRSDKNEMLRAACPKNPDVNQLA
jgi:hypothetical protein